MKPTGSGFRDVRPDHRKMVKVAARRSGLSVSQWLDAVIIEAASKQGASVARSASETLEKEQSNNELTIRAVHKRLDDLAEKIQQSTKRNPYLPEPMAHFDTRIQLLRLEDAINRLADQLRHSILDVPSNSSGLDRTWQGRFFLSLAFALTPIRRDIRRRSSEA